MILNGEYKRVLSCLAVLFQHSFCETEEIHENTWSGQQITGPKFGTSISHMQMQSVSATPSFSVTLVERLRGTTETLASRTGIAA